MKQGKIVLGLSALTIAVGAGFSIKLFISKTNARKNAALNYDAQQEPAADIDSNRSAKSKSAVVFRAPASSGVAVAKLRLPSANDAASGPSSAHAALTPNLKERLFEIDRIKSCYQTKCDYKAESHKEYGFAVGQDLKQNIYGLVAEVESTRALAPELSEAARDAMANTDGHVQEAALALMATQAPSSENMQALLTNIVAGNDAQLIEATLHELNRYKTPSERETIHAALADALVTGAPFVSREVSTQLAPFIDSSSYSYYAQVVTQLPAGSKVQQNLRAILLDYTRRQTGA